MIETRRLVVVLVALALLPPSLASAAPRTAIVVPTQLNGLFPHREDWQHELDLWLSDRLRMVQFTISGSSLLTHNEAQCMDADCLAEIAKVHGVDTVVAARVINDQQDLTTFHLMVRMLIKGAAGETPTMRERNGECPNCSLSAVRDQLVVLEGAALANTPAPEAKSKTETPRSNGSKFAPPVPPAIEYEDRFSRREQVTFKSIGVPALVIGVGALIGGFVELSRQGDVVVQNGQRYERETGTGQAVLFSVGGVLAAGGATLVGLGWSHLKRPKRVSITPSVGPTGASVQMRLGF